MNTVKFKLKDIKENSKYRPDGYFEDVVSNGIINGEYIEIEYEMAVLLVQKYSEKNPIIGLKNDKEIWGPILWKELHDRAQKYEMDIDAEIRWIKIFTSWIPCGSCKNHFKNIIENNPPDFSTKENYIKWSIYVHNIVNKSLGRPLYESDSNN